MAVCTTVQPVFHADLCDPQIHYGEINQLYFTRLGDSLTDWTDVSEWNGRLSNTTALPALPTLAKIRTLYGLGSIGAPERSEIRLPRKTKTYTIPKYSSVFRVTDTGQVNMDGFADLPVGGQVYAAWFGTEEVLFGGNDGVTMTIIGDPIIPESVDELMIIQVTFSWEGTFPEMQDNILS